VSDLSDPVTSGAKPTPDPRPLSAEGEPLRCMCGEVESNRWHHEPNRSGWHPFVPESDEPSPWNEDPCPVCGGYMDRPHDHEPVTDPATPAPLDARHAALVEAARDLYSIAVGEHGHDETHSADWPCCLPAHIAMNRYRAALDEVKP
jgi:hypothetical protein